MAGKREQLAVLAVAAVAGCLYLTLSYTPTTLLIFYNGTVLVAVVVAAVGAWRVRRERLRPWLLLTIALTGFLVAESMWWWFEVHGEDPFPSAADIVFLLSYIALGLSAAAQAHGDDADPLDWRDAAVLTVVTGAGLWVLLIQPYASDPDRDFWSKCFAIAYPLADLFVIALIFRLLLSKRGQTPATLLFAGGVLLTFAADTTFGLWDLAGKSTSGTIVEVGWMFGYILMAVAALDPTAATRPRLSAHQGRGRAVAVLLAALAPPLLLLGSLSEKGELGATGPTVAAVAGMLVSGLVAVRLWSLLRRVRLFESRLSKRMSAIVDHLSDAVVLLDENGKITYASPAVSIWGREPADCVGEYLADWLVAADRAGLSRQLASLRTAGHEMETTVSGHMLTAGQDICLFEGSVRNLLADDAVGALVATLSDTTNRRELEAQLRRQAFQDDLTGLANRALFNDRLQNALHRAARHEGIGVTVMFIDLDDFKAVNDGLGHAAGDELLRNVADRINICVRVGDTVARLGGDEFAVLLEDVSTMEEASGVAQRVLEMLMLPVRVLDDDIAVPASIGLAPRSRGSSADSLLRDADIAMYSAKANGKGRIEIFDETLRSAAQRRLHLRIDLPRALAGNQLRVAYQPLYRIAEGDLTGFEALLRWDHPELGAITPGEFIPVAESSGFILELGRFVLAEACAQAAAWNRDSPTALTMNVNVSGVQLTHGNFTKVVLDTLAETRLDPRLLTLELTESVLIDHERVHDVLEVLRDLGVGIALDDFGTGYSSLSYLHGFPISSVKIDREFISQLSDASSAHLVRSVVDMAEALGLKTVAEGVETDEQLAMLSGLGCDVAQGFYLGRPQSPGQIERILAEQRVQVALPSQL